MIWILRNNTRLRVAYGSLLNDDVSVWFAHPTTSVDENYGNLFGEGDVIVWTHEWAHPALVDLWRYLPGYAESEDLLVYDEEG